MSRHFHLPLLLLAALLISVVGSSDARPPDVFGTVLYGNGEPRAGVQVWAHDPGCAACLRNTLTDENGYFEFNGVFCNECPQGHGDGCIVLISVCNLTRGPYNTDCFVAGEWDTGVWVPNCAGGPCFLAGTEISIPGGSTVPIERIAIGQRVEAFDSASVRTVVGEVTYVHPRRFVESYLVINGSLRVTEEHPLLSSGAWVEAGKLRVGDDLTAPDGSPVEVRSIDVVAEKAEVFNIAVDGLGTFIAGGYVAHNKNPPSEILEP